jgi:hypothetical protein
MGHNDHAVPESLRDVGQSLLAAQRAYMQTVERQYELAWKLHDLKFPWFRAFLASEEEARWTVPASVARNNYILSTEYHQRCWLPEELYFITSPLPDRERDADDAVKAAIHRESRADTDLVVSLSLHRREDGLIELFYDFHHIAEAAPHMSPVERSDRYGALVMWWEDAKPEQRSLVVEFFALPRHASALRQRHYRLFADAKRFIEEQASKLPNRGHNARIDVHEELYFIAQLPHKSFDKSPVLTPVFLSHNPQTGAVF